MNIKPATKQTPLVIGISGGSGSGKTMIAEKLKNEYGEKLALVINQDAYYKDLSHIFICTQSNSSFICLKAFLTTFLQINTPKKITNGKR